MHLAAGQSADEEAQLQKWRGGVPWLAGFDEEPPWYGLDFRRQECKRGEPDVADIVAECQEHIREVTAHVAAERWWAAVGEAEAARLLLAEAVGDTWISCTEGSGVASASAIREVRAEVAMLQAVALEKLGLLDSAERRYLAAATGGKQGASDLLVEVARRRELIESTSSSTGGDDVSQDLQMVLDEEVCRLAAAAGKKAACWASKEAQLTDDVHRRAELVEVGFLPDCDARVGNPGATAAPLEANLVKYGVLLHTARRRLAVVLAGGQLFLSGTSCPRTS
eukprot:gnl/TRDRNA2_/TRDRNA2_135596_c0_seq2.p2 gnl/TRDRNA2_/TRDRNA2_135596_c0~~gnl/TRDRNA2_/TRDRNA2_135596_c0_seq2.p2  ORF type:complete len:281 (+),score=55.94 gnl/TRDRNA2_/TRDRNA2_135596_c0_seq2:91-933(+)